MKGKKFPTVARTTLGGRSSRSNAGPRSARRRGLWRSVQEGSRAIGGELGSRSLRTGSVTRYVFLDDLAATGHQAREYSADLVDELKSVATNIQVLYLTLFATSSGLTTIRKTTSFDRVDCVMELDSSFCVFGAESRYFDSIEPSISRAFAEQICRLHGTRLCPAHPLGYSDSQLLLGFHHNIPDNTLPIIWFDDSAVPWTPIFRRYAKF